MSTISDERDAGRLLTVDEVARLLRLSRAAIYRRLAAGELAAVRLGRAPAAPLRVRADALEAYLKAGSKKLPAASIASHVREAAAGRQPTCAREGTR